jgi:hypothetical protein
VVPIYSAVIMNVQKSFLPVRVGLSLSLALVPLGCSKEGSSSSSVDPKGEAAHIAKAAGHVAKYLTENKGKPPKDTAEMKDWAAKNSIAEDELLSSRDHEPYEVHEVAKGGTMKELVVTEKTGAKGRKFVWRSRSPSPLGIEQEQADIDTALKSSAGGRPGGPSR